MNFPNDKYILDEDRNVRPEPDLIKWGQFFEQSEKRVVGKTEIGNSKVSTVFLGLDHSWGFERPTHPAPILWETMVFGGKLEGEMDRCSGTWEQAEAMHMAMVERVEAVEALKRA